MNTPYGVCPDTEVAIPLPQGYFFVFPSAEMAPEGCNYVRIVSDDGGEIGYWDSQEWEDEAVEVMGAICGSMLTTEKARPDKYYQFTANVKFPEGVEFVPCGN